MNESLVLDTVPVSETLSQLACQSYNNTKDFYVRAMVKQDLPKRYHYSNNPRIDDIVLDVADQYYVVDEYVLLLVVVVVVVVVVYRRRRCCCCCSC